MVANAATLARLERHEAPGAGVLAVSDSLLAWRTRDAAGTDRIWVAGPGEPARVLLDRAAPEELGRPALLGNRLLCHVAGPLGSQPDRESTRRRARSSSLRSEPGAQLSNPATDGNLLLYVHATGRAQELRLGTLEPLATADDEVLLVHRVLGPPRPRARARPQAPPPSGDPAGAAAARRARRRRHAVDDAR